jgi:HK97 family phage major capsid protein
MGLYYQTGELSRDAAMLEAAVSQEFVREFQFQLQKAVFFGGAGQPSGITTSPACITVPKVGGQTANTILADNIEAMRYRLWESADGAAVPCWFISMDLRQQLSKLIRSVGAAGGPALLYQQAQAGERYGRMLDFPVVCTEFQPVLGSLGDIILADLSQYLILEGGGIQGSSSVHVDFESDQEVWKFTYRCDGAPKWHAPCTPYNGGDSLSPFVTLQARS